jgi:hypothetical protein
VSCWENGDKAFINQRVKGISLSQSCETTAWDRVLATIALITHLWILSDGIDTWPSVNLLMLSGLLARLVIIIKYLYENVGSVYVCVCAE